LLRVLHHQKIQLVVEQNIHVVGSHTLESTRSCL
jgi:hypothetical protein